MRELTWTVGQSDCAYSPENVRQSDGSCRSERAGQSEPALNAVLSAGLERGADRCREKRMTVEQFLRARGCSHHVLTHLNHTDHGILRIGEWTYTNQPVFPGDEITIRLIEQETSDQIVPTPIPITIVYEDEDVLVVDKPCDMPVHPSMGNHENTLANAVMYYYSEKGVPFVFRCVTRLDRDTTGLVVLAKNMLSSAILSDMSAHRQIHREYLAITEGILPEEGTIDAPIARVDGSPLMRCVDYENGERAVTHFECLGVYIRKQGTADAIRMPGSVNFEKSGSIGCELLEKPDLTLGAEKTVTVGRTCICSKTDEKTPDALPAKLSLASVILETGRTHQIRVHMKSIGHPLPGDFLYHPESVCDLAPRQMLHAHRVTFPHPITGKMLSFESAVPRDMRQLLDAYQISDI
ncbi:MAG: RluA family pseudouridine synthase [Lachnospiraceae bacterium]|nr:RluA family pseudouridine synthase [Lachnospiraceae bacterium]